MDEVPHRYWPPPEEREATERRLKALRPLWAIISCALGGLLVYAIWLKFFGS